MKRTVVDLSFSLFMSHKFFQPDGGLSLPRSNEDAGGQLNDISEVSSCEEFRLRLRRNQEVDVQHIRQAERAYLPH